MSILVDQHSRVIVQGITGRHGSFHARQIQAYANNLVGGISPGHGGEWELDGQVPIFDTVMECVSSTDANTSVILVPAFSASDAIIEAIDAGIKTIVCISAGIPIKDMLFIKALLKRTETRLIGPNSPGIFAPGVALAGVIPTDIAVQGTIGVASRSGTLTYETLNVLKQHNLGVSTALGLGDDPVVGTNFVDCLELFETDPHTDKILLIGEAGGLEEEKAADYITDNVTKPVVAYVAGTSITSVKIIGHPGIGLLEDLESPLRKQIAFHDVGVRVANFLNEIPGLLA